MFKECSPERAKEHSGNITQGVRKLFWFNVFDSLKENNYRKINPITELNALYEHYLSPRAVKNYLRREFTKEMNIISSLNDKK